jgi:hypothetical protein
MEHGRIFKIQILKRHIKGKKHSEYEARGVDEIINSNLSLVDMESTR